MRGVVRWGVYALAGFGCGPGVVTGLSVSTGQGGESTSSPVDRASSSSEPTASSTSSGAVVSTSSSSGSDGSSSTGVVFPIRCDTFEQDCPAGYKCNPSSNDGNLALDWTTCVPVSEEPDAIGEPCSWETDSQSGLDSCEVGAACHNRDWFARSGHCLELCGGTVRNPACRDEGDRCFVSTSTSVHSCHKPCSLDSDPCRPHERCVPTSSDGLHCVALAEGPGQLGDACVGPAECADGLLCGPSAPSLCGDDSELCCLPLCDVNAPNCPNKLVCAPWYDDPPPGNEQVGVCQDAG